MGGWQGSGQDRGTAAEAPLWQLPVYSLYPRVCFHFVCFPFFDSMFEIVFVFFCLTHFPYHNNRLIHSCYHGDKVSFLFIAK